MKRLFYDAQELSEILGICYSKALAFIKNSGINYIQINRTYLISVSEFNDFIKSHKYIKI